MALPGSGLLWMTQIRDEFRPGAAVYDLYSYYRNHGIITNNANNANIPWIGSMIWFSQFHGAFKANAGSWDQGTPGTYSIWVPPCGWLRMRCWGAGAGGGAYNGSHGTSGTSSYVSGYLTADGGSRGLNGSANSSGSGGGGVVGNPEPTTMAGPVRVDRAATRAARGKGGNGAGGGGAGGAAAGGGFTAIMAPGREAVDRAVPAGAVAAAAVAMRAPNTVPTPTALLSPSASATAATAAPVPSMAVTAPMDVFSSNGESK